MTFHQDILRFQARTKDKMDRAVQAVVREIATNVAKRTPVGTYDFIDEGWQDEDYTPGALVANWRVTTNFSTLMQEDSLGPTRDLAIARLEQEAKLAGAGSVVFIQNNSRYCEVLEFGLFPWRPATKRTVQGFSTQAATGMARTGFVDAVSRLGPILEVIGRT